MAKFSKNLMKSLAQQASGSGGISQAQQELNKGYEQIALKFATWLSVGMAIDAGGEHADIFEAVEGDERTIHIIGQAQQALLQNGGVAVGDLMRALFPNIDKNAPTE